MSRTESRRPIRVLSAAEIAQLQQQQQAPRNAVQVAALQSADRFRRTLAGSSRRAEPAPLAQPSSPPAPQTSAGQRNQAAQAKPPAGPQLQPVVEEAAAIDNEPAPVEQLAAAAMEWRDLTTQELPENDASTGLVAEGLSAPGLSHDPWPEQMAETIASLCARAAPSFVNWTVTLPMDPQVLPETDLRLSLSQHWLSLRFITQSPQSHHLVCRYRQSLLEQLERMPNLPHGIDIEVT